MLILNLIVLHILAVVVIGENVVVIGENVEKCWLFNFYLKMLKC